MTSTADDMDIQMMKGMQKKRTVKYTYLLIQKRSDEQCRKHSIDKRPPRPSMILKFS